MFDPRETEAAIAAVMQSLSDDTTADRFVRALYPAFMRQLTLEISEVDTLPKAQSLCREVGCAFAQLSMCCYRSVVDGKSDPQTPDVKERIAYMMREAIFSFFVSSFFDMCAGPAVDYIKLEPVRSQGGTA